MAGEGAAESWYVRSRGRVLGPLSWEQLRALRDRGRLARFDQVSRDRQSWAPADSLEPLFPRGGSGGAFASSSGTKVHGPGRSPEPGSMGFLLLDDEEASGPGLVADIRTAGPPADEPTDWYYAEAGAPQGPVGYSELHRLAKGGRIGPGTLYWRSGLEQWTAGSDLPELNRLWLDDADPGEAAGGVALPARTPVVEPGQSDAVPRINPIAIVSLAVNLFCAAGNLAAIVVGVVALRQIARSKGTLAGKGFAMGGIALGVAGLVTSALVYYWFFHMPGG